MGEYRVLISYRVFEEAIIEADSEQEARGILENGAIACDFYTTGQEDWTIDGVEELRDE